MISIERKFKNHSQEWPLRVRDNPRYTFPSFRYSLITEAKLEAVLRGIEKRPD
jgi:hypothetical protein